MYEQIGADGIGFDETETAVMKPRLGNACDFMLLPSVLFCNQT